MAVAFDASSLSTTFTTGNGTSTHTPVGTPRGVVVQTFQVGGAEDQVGPVDYGGVAMTLVRTDATSGATESGRVHTHFLGSGIPTGVQTVTVDGTGSRTKIFLATTLTANDDTTADTDAGGTANATANPSLAITPSTAAAILYVVVVGLDAPVTTVEAGSTHLTGNDRGTQSGMWAYKTVGSGGATTIGYTTAATDWAHAAVAVREPLTATASTLTLLGVS